MGKMLDYMQALLLPWVSKGPLVTINRKPYQRTVAAFGQIGDEFRDDCTFGARETMLEECTADAYPNHLANSNLQVIPNEGPTGQLAALRRRWLQWQEAGGYEGMIHALNRLGYSNVVVWSTLDLMVLGLINPFASLPNFFFVEIDQPNGISPGPLWDGGGLWKDTEELWGLSGITREGLEALLYTIRKFKPATHSCRFVSVDLGIGARILPMNEPWELQPNGAYNEYYNLSPLVP